jgi:hypothetical protein
MKNIKQLIEDENKANKAADDKLRCFAINSFGTGDHAYADSSNLNYFKAHYIRACLLKCAASDRVREDVRSRAMTLAGVQS